MRTATCAPCARALHLCRTCASSWDITSPQNPQLQRSRRLELVGEARADGATCDERRAADADGRADAPQNGRMDGPIYPPSCYSHDCDASAGWYLVTRHRLSSSGTRALAMALPHERQRWR